MGYHGVAEVPEGLLDSANAESKLHALGEISLICSRAIRGELKAREIWKGSRMELIFRDPDKPDRTYVAESRWGRWGWGPWRVIHGFEDWMPSGALVRVWSI
ncbi:MAG: hypothetical protein C4291_14790 [Candidatus Dadabacteria bacterium]